MAERRLLQSSDDELGSALRDLAPFVAWPEPRLAPNGPDLATRIRAGLVAQRPPSARRPLRWALVLAIVALLVLAAVAGAVAFGVPGIRLIFGDPDGSPPPAIASPTTPAVRPGAGLDLGDAVTVAELEARTGFPVLRPSDPALGAPDATYLSGRNEVAMVWAPRQDLPPTVEPDVGLLLMQFRGSASPEAIGKIIATGTVVEPVAIGDGSGFWIAGDPHVYFYISPEGEHIEEGRRWVGDALIWQRGEMTYRLESSLGRDETVRIAESLE